MDKVMGSDISPQELKSQLHHFPASRAGEVTHPPGPNVLLFKMVMIVAPTSGIATSKGNFPSPLVPGKQAFREHRVKDEHSGLAEGLELVHIALIWQRKQRTLADDYVEDKTRDY